MCVFSRMCRHLQCTLANCPRQPDAGVSAERRRTFVAALAVPVVVATLALTFIARTPARDTAEDGHIFTDPETGTVFETQGDALPERDGRVRAR